MHAQEEVSGVDLQTSLLLDNIPVDNDFAHFWHILHLSEKLNKLKQIVSEFHKKEPHCKVVAVSLGSFRRPPSM